MQRSPKLFDLCAPLYQSIPSIQVVRIIITTSLFKNFCLSFHVISVNFNCTLNHEEIAEEFFHSMLFLQDDDDGHLLALQIIRDLVDKGGDLFLDQLARLGVISKVSTLAGPSSDDENEEESKPEKVRI